MSDRKDRLLAIVMMLVVICVLFVVPSKWGSSEPRWITVIRWLGRLTLLGLATYGLWSLSE